MTPMKFLVRFMRIYLIVALILSTVGVIWALITEDHFAAVVLGLAGLVIGFNLSFWWKEP